jgi:asparagine synthase (glutamine-hydrolysing)
MCGIAGIIEYDPHKTVELADIRRMCNAIIHRGPDDEGIYVSGPAGLGARRLSIIDLATGHQPIQNEDGNVWVALNGEIYNFQELRCGLEDRGHRFRTRTDTEVIVHLYEEWGAECVTRLRGMFAFAVYDERDNSCLLARDRLGKKPLVYASLGDTLLFGSEIKCLLAVKPELRERDLEGLFHYFHFGYVPDPLSAFRKIRKLPPGHVLRLANGQIEVRPYWTMPRFVENRSMSEGECLDAMEERLDEATRIRMNSDVPLGAFLSGGVDSSTIVALMARRSGRAVKTFSIAFPEADFDESEYARAVSRAFGTEHHEFVVRPNLTEDLASISAAMEEPFADSSMIPTYHVCRLARQHVTVALSGDGGDELFGGYDRYSRVLGRTSLDRIPESLGDFYRRRVYPHLPSGFPARRLMCDSGLGPRERYLNDVSLFDVSGRDRELFSPDILHEFSAFTSPLSCFADVWGESGSSDAVSSMQYLDLRTYLPFDILAKVDRMSMMTSLEVRAPMLDQEFVSWAATVPASHRVAGQEHKAILKKLAVRLGVPQSVIYRPKQGFAVPLVHWMRGSLKHELVDILLEPKTLQRGYMRRAGLQSLVDEHASGRRDHSHRIWLLLMLELWHRNYLDADSYSAGERGDLGREPSSLCSHV